MSSVISDGYYYLFPNMYVNDTDYITLQIRIEDTSLSGMTSIDPDANGLVVKTLGSLKWSFDLDDPFIIPGSMEFEFFDPNEVLAGKIFDHTNEATIDPRAQVFLSLNGVVIYDSVILEDSIIWEEAIYSLQFNTLSNIEEINNQLLWDLDNSTHFNPHGYTFTPGGTYWPTLRTMITNIWQTISPTLTVDFYSRWTLQDDGAATYNLFNTGIRISHHYFYNYSYKDVLNLVSDGDVLRHLCYVFNCYTGFISRSKGFFKQLFVYDSGNTQTLGTVLNHRKQFLKTQVDYVRYVSTNGSVGDYDYVEGTLEQSGVQIKKIERDPMWHGFDPSYEQQMAYYGSGSVIENCQDTGIDSTWRDCLEMAVKQVYYHRNNIFRQRQDYFHVEGIDYEFHKNFQYDSRNYQITELSIDFETNTSEIIAIKV